MTSQRKRYRRDGGVFTALDDTEEQFLHAPLKQCEITTGVVTLPPEQ